MIEPRHGEAGSRVAVVASSAGRNVVGGFPLCAHAVMALGTMLRRAFENTVQVAGAALDQIVCAGKRKTGEKVIELLCLLWRRKRGMQTHQQHQQTRDVRRDQCRVC